MNPLSDIDMILDSSAYHIAQSSLKNLISYLPSTVVVLCGIDDLWGDAGFVVGATGLGSEEVRTKEKRIT
jgi:hypothetical protein